ncbi:hypothetical protein [Streptomyces sp. H27-C3]|uniref:hypothetical protein n=1 Tax=Streptomyces sp. H27-C3 TaxID=3046305 RepID=UPI0024BB56A7|nr:hypothetical protein [Streptomyces sp. H27-C3]MDJ0463071.1 hypothetical protein [Streptomyces sp. H27-C3]
MNDLHGPHNIVEEMEEAAYANGRHYDPVWLRENAVPAESGDHPTTKIIVDLNLGDSVAVLSSGKGKKVWGPNSVETTFWSDGSVSQTVHDLGKAPEMPRTTPAGRFQKPDAHKRGKPKPDARRGPREPDTQTFEWDGASKTVREWYAHPDRHESLSKEAFRNRLKELGWDVQRALTTPARKHP